MFRFYSSNHEEALSTGTSTSSEELAGLVSYRRDDFKNREKEIRDTQRKSGCLRLVLEDDALQFVDVVDKILPLTRQFRDEVEANKAEATRDNNVFH